MSQEEQLGVMEGMREAVDAGYAELILGDSPERSLGTAASVPPREALSERATLTHRPRARSLEAYVMGAGCGCDRRTATIRRGHHRRGSSGRDPGDVHP